MIIVITVDYLSLYIREIRCTGVFMKNIFYGSFLSFAARAYIGTWAKRTCDANVAWRTKKKSSVSAMKGWLPKGSVTGGGLKKRAAAGEDFYLRGKLLFG